MSHQPIGTRNHLLAALPEDEYQRLKPYLRPLTLTAGQVLHEKGKPLDWAYFPSCGLISLSITSSGGKSLGIDMVGHEGIVGSDGVCGATATLNRAVVQMPGSGWAMSTVALRDKFQQGGVLQEMLLMNLQMLHNQTTQAAVCYQGHNEKEQLSRWLLAAQDTVGTPHFPMRDEFAREMLGTPFSEEAFGTLQRAGLIRYQQGQVSILNRDELQQSACSCYQCMVEMRQRYELLAQQYEKNRALVQSNQARREQARQQRQKSKEQAAQANLTWIKFLKNNYDFPKDAPEE